MSPRCAGHLSRRMEPVVLEDDFLLMQLSPLTIASLRDAGTAQGTPLFRTEEGTFQ